MAEIGADKLGGLAESAGKEAAAGSEEAAQLSGAAGMAEGGRGGGFRSHTLRWAVCPAEALLSAARTVWAFV